MLRPRVTLFDLRPLAREWPQLRVLQAEEALLRSADQTRAYCILSGVSAPAPTVVMGLSGRLTELCDVAKLRARPEVRVIRRFTGGGTVVTDASTVLASFVGGGRHLRAAEADGAAAADAAAAAAGLPLPHPQALMRWTAGVYGEAFGRLGVDGFSLLGDQDYCVGDRKVGGSAQAISKDRWIHHTSWLWAFEPANMALLTLPAKRPEYRASRVHGDFLTTLERAGVPSGPALGDATVRALEARGFDVDVADAAALVGLVAAEHGSEAAWAAKARSQYVDVEAEVAGDRERAEARRRRDEQKQKKTHVSG